MISDSDVTSTSRLIVIPQLSEFGINLSSIHILLWIFACYSVTWPLVLQYSTRLTTKTEQKTTIRNQISDPNMKPLSTREQQPGRVRSSDVVLRRTLSGGVHKSQEDSIRQTTPITSNEVTTAVHLADMDDLVTRLVIDPYLGFQTHKMDIGYHSKKAAQGLLSTHLQLIVDYFVRNSDHSRAHVEIHDLVLQHQLHISKMDFRYFHIHLTAYLELLDPNNGLAIQACRRYTGDREHGAKIITTKIRERGEMLKILGVYAILTPDEMSTLIGPHNNFSIKVTSRPKRGGRTQLLYLGPAAFVNHSCSPNCEEIFDKTSPIGLPQSHLKVIRSVDAGEELTISYGPNYFEKNECLCGSCKPTEWMDTSLENFGEAKYNLRRTASRLRFKSRRLSIEAADDISIP